MSRADFNRELLDFLARATTPFHAVRCMSERLAAAGFERLEEGTVWQLAPAGRYYITRNDSSIIAFTGGADAAAGLRMVGAHTDSPCLMVKPNPEIFSKGYMQLGVEVYGGALLNPWFDRDLSLAGRLSYRCSGGRLQVALVDFREPLACIPSLAIHLDREANQQRSVNPQQHLPPVLCLAGQGDRANLRGLLLERLREEHPGCDAEEVLDYELSFYDTQPAAVIGLNREFIASARLDNLLSCFVGLRALLDAEPGGPALLVCNDHEEVGSMSASGAQGPFLQSVLQRLAGGDDALGALVDRSLLISTDNAHGIHPNFADRHDDNHGPALNGGPVIKVNASQRYATNSETSGLFRLLCAREDVPVQSFVMRSDLACGSTIGPLTAGTVGVRTLDVGVPTFAMHSVRELAGTDDAFDLYRVLGRFYAHPGPLAAS